MQLTERQLHHLERMQAYQAQQELLIKILEVLQSERNRQKNLAQRSPVFETVAISSGIAYKLDYRDRKHIYLYSTNALLLSLEDLGQVTVPANTWTNISFNPGMFLYAVGQTATVYVEIKHTDDQLFSSTLAYPAVGDTLPAFATNAAATGIGTDVTYKFGPNGTTQFNHVSIQNNGSINVLYAFDVATTTAGASVYTLAPGQVALWDRPGVVLHFQTAAAVNFNGTTGITVEAFA